MSVSSLTEARKKKDVIEALRQAVMRLKAHFTELYDEHDALKRHAEHLERENADLRAKLRGRR